MTRTPETMKAVLDIYFRNNQSDTWARNFAAAFLDIECVARKIPRRRHGFRAKTRGCGGISVHTSATASLDRACVWLLFVALSPKPL